jgi:hypothetical protein
LIDKIGGRDRDRTGDPLLAKQVLSQLSYTPTKTTLILNHLSLFRIPSLAKIVVTVPDKLEFPVGAVPDTEKLCQLALSSHLACRSSFSRLLSSFAGLRFR